MRPKSEKGGCLEHPSFQGKSMPHGSCLTCWRIYAGELWDKIDDLRKRNRQLTLALAREKKRTTPKPPPKICEIETTRIDESRQK